MTRGFVGFIVLLGLALAGCVFNPISQTATPGSTIAVPLIGERIISINTSEEHADASAFGSSYFTDTQRGLLFAVLCPAGQFSSMAGCLNSSSKIDAPIRWVTRVYPDPASQAGIDNVVQDMPTQQSQIPMGGEVLLLLDIPTSISTAFNNCGGCTTLSYNLFVGRHRPFGGGDETSILNDTYNRTLVVAKGTGQSSPNAPLYPYAQVPDLGRMTPYPKCVFTANSAATNLVGAGDLTITIPANVTVKDVIEEEHLGRHSMVRWNTVSSSSIHVTLLAPEAAAPGTDHAVKAVNRLAVVFQLSTSASSAPTASQFSVTSQTLYDVSGNPLGGSALFAPEVIR